MLAVCNGPRRSGSTLQFNLTRSLVELSGTGNGGPFFTRGQLTTSEIEHMITLEDWIVIKAHHAEPAILAAASQSPKCQILVTYRDLRDVAISVQKFWQLPWDETLVTLSDSVALIDLFEAHDHSLVQRYEDLVWHTTTAIEEIASHLMIPLNRRLMDDLLEACSIESAYRAIKSIPWRRRSLARAHSMWRAFPKPFRTLVRATVGEDFAQRIIRHSNVVEPATHLHPQHISRWLGEPGAWRQVLTTSQLNEIETMFKDWLVSHNYDLSLT